MFSLCLFVIIEDWVEVFTICVEVKAGLEGCNEVVEVHALEETMTFDFVNILKAS